MKVDPRHSLSVKLLQLVLLWALLAGMLLSLAQILFDFRTVRESIARDADEILAMFHDPASQAIFSLDKEMATQVIEGLFANRAVHFAAIGHPQEAPLASRERPLSDLPYRYLTDLLFGVEQRFSIPLLGRAPYNEYYGDLQLTLETGLYGQTFLRNSMIILVSGLLRALVMAGAVYLVYHVLLTRPLARIIEHISEINPEQSGRMMVPMLPGQEKNELGLLITKINQLLDAIERHRSQRHEAEASLLHMAQHDNLTGLPNRSILLEQLTRVLADARRRQRSVAVLCCGLDDFKEINEKFSYQAGDRLLVAVAERLQSHSGRLTSVARLGGDQFALIVADVNEPYEVAELAQQMLDELSQPFPLDDSSVILRATIGITLFPDDGMDASKLLQKAEQTMMLAKIRSRNRYQFYIASVDSEMRVRRELASSLRDALMRNEFHLVYQPQIDLTSRRVVGVEALLRWHHPERGLVPPDLFIPLAEQSGAIIAIGEWVLDQACRQLRDWQQAGRPELRMSVNLSTVQLHHPDLSCMVTRVLQRYALPRNCLELEVTETGLMEDIQAAAKHLNELKSTGVQIALDDFGTGYSSLSYLRGLPLDKIKIDKSFTGDLLVDHDDRNIVRITIQLGRNLNMQVIAEGVESAEQEAYLSAEGCHEGQGYFYSRPLTAAALVTWMDDYEQTLAAADQS
ncbi:putative bifunctional diguanylate cyclase/phosphodiesterase [Halopseudomonas xiamenensis]|uniref:putative bifunctional diguanylate cyclase/phosphodiesterase n=1 Tax=Halopseudomonas xiamenensis TaxID=157792 RepID=UPI0016289EBD|nr:GGDEF domain-containing phosphodiesterase [Halopseudomonas xiamenensis]